MSSLKPKVYKPHNEIDSKINLIDKKLFKPPLRQVYLGRTMSGKTNMLKNILFRKEYGYLKYYDEIYFFTDTTDEIFEISYLALKNKVDDKFTFVNGFNPEKVEKLYNDIKKDFRNLEEGKEPTRVLMIFDDLITSGISKSNKPTVLDKIFQNGRHYSISIIVLTQSYKAINRNMRSLNISQLFIFYGVPEKELEMVAEEHSTIILGKKDLLQVLKNQLTQPYTFVVIDHNRPINERFLDNDFNIINTDNINL